MKLLAFAATNNTNSINKKLVTHVCDLLQEQFNCQSEIIDLNDYEMPIYRPDREIEGGIPNQAELFYKKIGEADRLVISFAEYNGSYTAAYKNLFDWTSRVDQKLYQNRPTFLMATSPGKRGGASVLKTAKEAAPHFGMDVKGSFSLPEFQKNFDLATGKIKDPELIRLLSESIKEFAG